MSAANGHLEIAKLLLINGSDVNVKNQSDNTPLRKNSSFLNILNDNFRLGIIKWKN